MTKVAVVGPGTAHLIKDLRECLGVDVVSVDDSEFVQGGFPDWLMVSAEAVTEASRRWTCTWADSYKSFSERYRSRINRNKRTIPKLYGDTRKWTAESLFYWYSQQSLFARPQLLARYSSGQVPLQRQSLFNRRWDY